MTFPFLLKKQVFQAVESIISWLPHKKPICDWRETYVAEWKSVWASEGYLMPLGSGCANDKMANLLAVDRQKQLVIQNTKQFIHGLPANHVLLTGAKGSGKSTLIRALLTEFAHKGLRLVQVLPQQLSQLSLIVGNLPKGFCYILFCDDLSFSHKDADYRSLKSVLDGGGFRLPDHVLIYATSNRRHLMPESRQVFGEEAELHPVESSDERISLSDRFGIWLTFYALSQADYLNICEHWIIKVSEQVNKQNSSIYTPVWNQEVERAALEWSLVRGHRSGRCAQQFANHWVGKSLLCYQ